MKLEEIEVGARYVYYPPRENENDNRHFPAVVEAVNKRARVRLFMEGAEDGMLKTVSPKRLVNQQDLI